MNSFLVSQGSSYLEWTPFDQRFCYGAGDQRHATPFTEVAARVMADLHAGHVVHDFQQRTPQFDLEDLDLDEVCHAHGKVKPMSEYGIRADGCEDCEPCEMTFDEALGVRCDAQERMAEAWRLKR